MTNIPEADREYAKDPKNWNSVANLQLLNSYLNESKNDTPLKDWVQTNNITYDALFVPSGTSLKIEDFKKFNEARKAFIVEHLKKIIG